MAKNIFATACSVPLVFLPERKSTGENQGWKVYCILPKLYRHLFAYGKAGGKAVCRGKARGHHSLGTERLLYRFLGEHGARNAEAQRSDHPRRHKVVRKQIYRLGLV